MQARSGMPDAGAAVGLGAAMGHWNVYIVRCADGTLYTGVATDVARRVGEHNSNKLLAANYTRATTRGGGRNGRRWRNA
jgi:hypothetical protein